MWNVKCILHPTDFSQSSANAFLLARAVARDYKAKLILLHVIEEPVILVGEPAPRKPADRDALEGEFQQIKASNPDVALEYRLAEGNPVVAILDVAGKEPCDLIIMGAQGRTELRRLLMGSVAENVVRNAACPVLTVTLPAAGG